METLKNILKAVRPYIVGFIAALLMIIHLPVRFAPPYIQYLVVLLLALIGFTSFGTGNKTQGVVFLILGLLYLFVGILGAQMVWPSLHF